MKESNGAVMLRWGPAFLLMVLIFIASSLPGDKLPKFDKFDLSVKKLGHATGYAFLAMAYLRGLTAGRSASRRDKVVAILLALAYAITDEIHQIFTPGRTASPIDVMIDTAGAAIGIFLWRRFSGRLRIH